MRNVRKGSTVRVHGRQAKVCNRVYSRRYRKSADLVHPAMSRRYRYVERDRIAVNRCVNFGYLKNKCTVETTTTAYPDRNNLAILKHEHT